MRKDFPSGNFFIKLRDTDLVIDVSEGSKDPGANIILWTQRDTDNDNQKWYYENGQIRNVKSGLVLAAPQLDRNVTILQDNMEGREGQRYDYYDYTISAKEDEDLVFGILTSPSEGARVTLIRRDNDSELQQWSIECA
ncbi:hypothetical protein FBU30_000269 [Linnemannia zychae]|nr:hypothetical protein FBU30_000269 [Linnemannia zychae]